MTYSFPKVYSKVGFNKLIYTFNGRIQIFVKFSVLEAYIFPVTILQIKNGNKSQRNITWLFPLVGVNFQSDGKGNKTF